MSTTIVDNLTGSGTGFGRLFSFGPLLAVIRALFVGRSFTNGTLHLPSIGRLTLKGPKHQHLLLILCHFFKTWATFFSNIWSRWAERNVLYAYAYTMNRKLGPLSAAYLYPFV